MFCRLPIRKQHLRMTSEAIHSSPPSLYRGKDEDTWSVLPGVGSHVGQDGHLVDVGVVFGVYSFEFGVEGLVSGAG